MSLAKCKTVGREIEEADHGENLTRSAMEHLGDCGQCHKFYDERLKLRQLIASLETVMAPADFDLRVRSRIANERTGARAGFWFTNFTLGIPSVALAGLFLVVGLVVALKVWNAPTTRTAAVQAETPKATEASSEGTQGSYTGSGVGLSSDNRQLATTRFDDRAPIHRDGQPKAKRPSSTAVASSRNGGRLATREFSNTLAPVIKKEETVAESSPIFLIETSSQPLRLSLDYSGGVSRTISVPALSFGSENVLTGGSAPLVKNSPKGAW